jgi:PleD family two-component response regulator
LALVNSAGYGMKRRITDVRQAASLLWGAVESARISTSAGELPITASLGVAEFVKPSTAQSLVSRADGALYSAKRNGRNRVVCADEKLAEPAPPIGAPASRSAAAQ